MPCILAASIERKIAYCGNQFDEYQEVTITPYIQCTKGLDIWLIFC